MGYLSRRADVSATWPVFTLQTVSEVTESPDCLVTEPAGVTLVETAFKGRLQLRGARNLSADIPTGLLSLRKHQCVAASDGSVVEQDACWEGRRRKLEPNGTKVAT